MKVYEIENMNFNERKEKFLSEYNALPSDMERFDYIINKLHL